LQQRLDVVKSNPELLEQSTDKSSIEEMKKAEKIAQYGSYGTFKQYSDTLEKDKHSKKIEQKFTQEISLSIKDIEAELQKITQDLEEIQKTKKELSSVEKKN